MKDYSSSNDNKAVGIFVTIAVILSIGLIILFSTITFVQEGHRGVKLTFGEASNEVLEPGIVFKAPFVQKVIQYEVRTLKYEARASAATKDLQDVSTQLAVNFKLNPSEVVSIHKSLGRNYGDRIIVPAVMESMKAVTARYNADELVQKRPEVRQGIEDILTEKLGDRNIILESLSITDFDFSDAFDAAIESKQLAAVSAVQAENKLLQIEVEARQRIATAEGEAESRKLAADAVAYETRVSADANAYQTRVKAEADAYALEIVNEQLSDSLIEYESIKKWQGSVPQYMGTGTPVPFVDVAIGGR